MSRNFHDFRTATKLVGYSVPLLLASSNEACRLDDRTVGNVVEGEENKTAGLYSISVGLFG